MKQLLTITAVLLMVASCTKDKGYFDEQTMTKLNISTTSMTKHYELMVGDELQEDSIFRAWGGAVPANKQRLRIRETGKTNYFIDTIIDIPRPSVTWSLLETDPDQPALFFTGFGEDVTAPAPGNVKFRILNIDTTRTTGMTVDINIYSFETNERIFEMKNIPHNGLSEFYEFPSDLLQGGWLEIVESANPENIIVSLDSYNSFSLSDNGRDNVHILLMSNDNGYEYPYYFIYPVVSGKK